MQVNYYSQPTLTQIPLSFAVSKNMNTSDGTEGDMALGERVRTVMDAMPGPDYGKQVRLAKVADTSKQVVNHWLTGRTTEISYESARRICDEYGFRIDWLMRSKGPARKDDPDEVQASKETVELVYLEPHELKLITKYRATTEMGRALIQAAIEHAPKD